MQRFQLDGGKADPMGKRAAVDANALGLQDLRLPVEGQMPGVFRDQHVGDEGVGGKATFDQPQRRRRLDDAVGAGSAGIFRPPRDDDAQPRRDPVEPFRDVLADDVQRAAAWAGPAFRFDDDFLARQMRRQMARLARRLFADWRLTMSLCFSALASSAARPVSISSSARAIWSSLRRSEERPK